MTDTNHEVFTTAEAARYLRCSKQWLEVNRDAEGKPPYVRVGKRIIRYRKTTLDQWLEQHEGKPDSRVNR